MPERRPVCFISLAKPPQPGDQRTWQGYSVANWERPVRGSGAPGFGLGATREGAHGKSLEVVTTQFRAGYLRKNGPPYSENTVLKEYYDLHKERNGDTWFTVTTVVRRSQVSDGAVRYQYRFQEDSRWRRMEPQRFAWQNEAFTR